MKTVEEINQKIKDGDVMVLTAAQMTRYVQENGVEQAAKDVDVVTTGTFGAMCSSGAFLNFGHSDPPIKMTRTYLNGVEAYSGLAAVDAYIGATQPNRNPEIGVNYGGAHLIEDLIRGKDIELEAHSYGTDCYPLTEVRTHINIQDLNQAIMVNPRNCYQNYASATNSTEETLYTYMGTLLPNNGNVTFSSAGELSPLLNDPYFQTLGIGTRIFLCGAEGYIIGEGTQHNTEAERLNGVPVSSAGTLMLKGDMKDMHSDYVRGAAMPKYGSTLYVGAGIPIPILSQELAERTSISDADIPVRIYDYGVPFRSRPVIKETNYAELKTGKIEINGIEVPTSPLSSYKKAEKITYELKDLIEKAEFYLSKPVKRLPHKGCKVNPLNIRRPSIMVKDLKSKPLIVAHSTDDIRDVARRLVENNINHLPVVDNRSRLLGIVTSWDIAHAVARDKRRLTDVMTKKVITAGEDEPVDVIARRIDKHEISGLPVVDQENRVKGMITAEDISRLIGDGSSEDQEGDLR